MAASMNSPHEFKNSNFLIRSYWLYLCDRWVGDSGTIEEKGRGGMAQSRRWKRGTQVGETEERRNGERKTETPKAEAGEEGIKWMAELYGVWILVGVCSAIVH